MAIEVSLNCPDAWLQLGSPHEFDLRHVDCSDTILKCPQQIGQGYSQRIPMRDGLSLVILDYEFRDDFIRDIRTFTPPLKLELEFVLRGPQAGQNRLILTSGRPIQGMINRYPGNQPISKVELHLQFPLLKVFFDGLLEQLPLRLQQLSRDFFEQLYGLRVQQVSPAIEQAYALIGWSAITPRMGHVLQQILDCPYGGLNRRVYLEAKALELMTLRSQQMVEQLMGFEQQTTVSMALPPDELLRIYQAKEILLSDLHHPPAVSELARQVGLNRRKLTEHFQQVFQMTPFEYLQDYRLQQAQHLLSQPDTTVEAVIKAVGYKSRSNFAVAFRKKFGLNPKHYQQQRWQLATEKVC